MMSLIHKIIFGRGVVKDAFLAAAIATSPVTLDFISHKVTGRHLISDLISGAYAQKVTSGKTREQIQQFQATVEPDSLTADVLNHFTASLFCNFPEEEAQELCRFAGDHSIFYGTTMLERVRSNG